MFLNFFIELRNVKVPVSLREYLSLLDCLDKNVLHSVRRQSRNSIDRTLAEAGLMESKKKYLFHISLENAEIDFACAEPLNVFLVNSPHEGNRTAYKYPPR